MTFNQTLVMIIFFDIGKSIVLWLMGSAGL